MMSTMMIALLSIPATMTLAAMILATLRRMAEPERVPVRVRAHRRPY